MRDSSQCAPPLRHWLALAAFALVAHAAHAQDNAQDRAKDHVAAGDVRRCTGEWRASAAERAASCTVLIESGRFQGNNLAILHDNRGAARRAQGDLAGATADFSAAIDAQGDFA